MLFKEPASCYSGSAITYGSSSFECSYPDSKLTEELTIKHPKCRQRSPCESLAGAAAGTVCPLLSSCEDIETTMGPSYHCVCQENFEKVPTPGGDPTIDFECKPSKTSQEAFKRIQLYEFVSFSGQRMCRRRSFQHHHRRHRILSGC